MPPSTSSERHCRLIQHIVELMLVLRARCFAAIFMLHKLGIRSRRPSNFFMMNPGINLPPDTNKASIEVDAGGSCCGGGDNGAITRKDEIRHVKSQACCAASSCRCPTGCTCRTCSCGARTVRSMQAKL